MADTNKFGAIWHRSGVLKRRIEAPGDRTAIHRLLVDPQGAKDERSLAKSGLETGVRPKDGMAETA